MKTKLTLVQKLQALSSKYDGLKKIIFRIRLILFPKYILENTFRYGVMYGDIKCMMNQGIIQHSPEKQKEILNDMDFKARYPNF